MAIPRGASIEAALRIARESGYSRFPVHAGGIDEIDGVVDARDLFEARERGRQGEIATLVQPAVVVPTSKKAKDLLAEMRLAQRHMALIVDAHGMVAGIVTLEDIFEAIVGDIRDEHDEPEAAVTVVGPRSRTTTENENRGQDQRDFLRDFTAYRFDAS